MGSILSHPDLDPRFHTPDPPQLYYGSIYADIYHIYIHIYHIYHTPYTYWHPILAAIYHIYMIFSHYQPYPTHHGQPLDLGFGVWIWGPTAAIHATIRAVCVHMYILYGVYSCIYTYIDTSAPCHPPADISRPQIGPDFRGFGVFSWMPYCVTCCYTYVIHTYTPHIPCIYVRMYVICCISCHPPSSAGHHDPQHPVGYHPQHVFSCICTYLHILYIYVYHMGYIGTYYTCATTC